MSETCSTGTTLSRGQRKPIGRLWTALLLVSSFFALVLSSCAPRAPGKAISLASLKPVLPARATGVIPLRVAVANVISPQGTLDSYQDLLDYLSAELDRPVELVQRRTYAETNELVRNGEVDMAFVCTSAYIAGHDQFGMQLLVAPVVNGVSVYHSDLIVPAASAARSIDDLRGAVFAFTDPMSFTGRIYPTFLIQQLGETPETFFGRTFYTYSHDDAIEAVAEGIADGAAVDSLVLDFAMTRDTALADRIRVIHRSPAFGIPPVVVGPQVRPQLRAQLQEILLGMQQDPDGKPPLDALDIDTFVLIDDEAYQSVRDLYQQVGIENPVAP